MYPYPLLSDFDYRCNPVGLRSAKNGAYKKSKLSRIADSDFLSKDNLLWQFFRASSLHGFKYVGMPERGTVERIFWAVGILGCIGFSIYLIYIGVVVPLTATPVLISFQSSDIMIDQIPFPAITICNVNKIKKSVIEDLERKVKRYFDCEGLLGPDNTKCVNFLEQASPAYYGLQYIGNICKRVSSFAKEFNYSSTLGNVHYDMERDYNMTNQTWTTDENNPFYRDFIRPTFRKAFINCSEMLLLCRFQNLNFGCQDLFSTVATEFGTCCVFNMVPQMVLRNLSKSHPHAQGINKSVEAAWRRWNIDSGLVRDKGTKGLDLPRHQQRAGMNTGLSVLLDPQLDQYHCAAQDSEGFRILAHSPIESPHVMEFGKAVQPNSETFVGLKGEITTIDKHVRHMSLEKRNCYMQGEFNLNTAVFYTETNCFDECIANRTFKKCNCTRYYQPTDASRPICSASIDAWCVKGVFDDIDMRGVQLVCDMCFPSCTHVQYYMETNWLPMRSDVDLWISNETRQTEKWVNGNLSVVHFYFTSDYVESRMRKALYGFRQIMANAGGLLGLAIGFSIISFVEPLYFLSIRCLSDIKKKKKRSESESTRKKTNSFGSSLVSSQQPLKVKCKPMSFGYLP